MIKTIEQAEVWIKEGVAETFADRGPEFAAEVGEDEVAREFAQILLATEDVAPVVKKQVQRLYDLA